MDDGKQFQLELKAFLPYFFVLCPAENKLETRRPELELHITKPLDIKAKNEYNKVVYKYLYILI